MDSGRPNLAGGTDGPSGSTRPQANAVPPRRRKNHRGGKKKKSRRKSFVAPSDDLGHDSLQAGDLEEIRENFYAQRGGNNSQTSLESEVLLDHREQNPFLRPRRPSTLPTSSSFQQHQQQQYQQTPSRLKSVLRGDNLDEGDENDDWNERAPLLSSSGRMRSEPAMESGGYGSNSNETAWRTGLGSRRDSSHASSRRKHLGPFAPHDANYNVNYPPSVPGSPSLRPTDMSFGDVMLRDDLARSDIPHSPRESVHRDGSSGGQGSKPQPSPLERRNTFALQAEEDVCFPHEGMSEIAEEDLRTRDPNAFRMRTRRRRHRWPDLSILEEWGRFEKEGRSEERRAKKITEPQLINGRLRPTHKGWYRTEEDAPYRFTYFNEEFQSTIHSSTISELVQPGGSFKELFIPDPPILSDSSDSESDDERDEAAELHQVLTGQNGDSKTLSHQPSLAQTTQGYFDSRRETKSPSHDTSRSAPKSKENSGDPTPAGPRSPNDLRSPQQKPKDSPRPNGSPPRPKSPKPPRYGDRPVWWLDVLCPTEQEMKVLSKAFAIHPLTSEDIMMQEAREKVELFRHYYFVNYRTFEQDKNKENFLEPVNMYVVVFREGVLSFHFSHTPHPANVRRRIRQLQDYMILSADWISYAIIDDITDVFFPLIQNIEDDVDDIDDAILQLHSSTADPTPEPRDPEKSPEQTGGDMLRRVGDCRKKVMGLYRLLGNKADVIKGFAKRCNEHWEVAPRSEIGLYLGDIQDHIVTMTANLSHYEKILARSHANYLAQINIRMNERQEQTADVLGRLTVLGTIVLPMNIITGLWGMNVWVPGQGYEEDLRWFIAITGGLIAFGIACYLVAKRVYGIV